MRRCHNASLDFFKGCVTLLGLSFKKNNKSAPVLCKLSLNLY